MMGIKPDWNDVKEIIIYGFGRVGHAHIEKILSEVNVICIIDNKADGKADYKGIPIYTLETCLNRICQSKIVVTASGKGYASIKASLEQHGYIEKEDFINFELFLSNLYWERYRKIGISKLVFPLTNRCTLNCQKCNSFMPYTEHFFDRKMEEVIKDIDIAFKYIDELSLLLLVGGEPLLYASLKELVTYIGENYKNRIGKVLVITNGTIIPDEPLCKNFARYHVEIRISNYGLSDIYLQKINKLKERLALYEVEYTELLEMEWLDIGFPEEKLTMGTAEEELYQHMMQCESYCHGICDGKFYFCTEALMAEWAGLYEIPEDDYIDLNNLDQSHEQKRMQLLEYQFGKMKNGYFSFCRYCRGLGPSNECVIMAGVQKKWETGQN
ncbi:MAG: radical SAM protein [Lachnospiraceae bacterium]|nr:radical SAM protein [Lachnospiraceae bacterium]